MSVARALLAALAGVALAGALTLAAQPAPEWRPFAATWTLAGRRTAIPTEGPRAAAIVHATGSLVVTKGETLGRGFFGELIGFDDGGTLLSGRAIFTDEKGDKVFAVLKAQPLGAGRTATAAITGGTGRWAGLEGDFTFAWKFVVASEDDAFDALALNVEGRVRRPPPKAAPHAEAPK